jgi:hypothetical protein
MSFAPSSLLRLHLGLVLKCLPKTMSEDDRWSIFLGMCSLCWLLNLCLVDVIIGSIIMNHHASWSRIVVTSMQCAWELCQVFSMRQVPVLGQNSAKVGLPPTLRPKVQIPDSYPATCGEKSLLTHQHLLCCQWHSTFYLSCFISLSLTNSFISLLHWLQYVSMVLQLSITFLWNSNDPRFALFV